MTDLENLALLVETYDGSKNSTDEALKEVSKIKGKIRHEIKRRSGMRMITTGMLSTANLGMAEIILDNGTITIVQAALLTNESADIYHRDDESILRLTVFKNKSNWAAFFDDKLLDDENAFSNPTKVISNISETYIIHDADSIEEGDLKEVEESGYIYAFLEALRLLLREIA